MEKIRQILSSKNPKILFSLMASLVILAYIAVSLAIDTGSLWYYLVALVALIYAIKYFYRGTVQLTSYGKKG